jgi:hypothetical protein
MPELTSEPVTCGHCGNISYMAIKGSINDTVTSGAPEVGYEISGTMYSVLECPACKEVSVTSYFWHEMMDKDDDIMHKTLYPHNKEFPVGLPANILSALTSAEKVKVFDAHAYALLLGRTLELVCYDREAKGDTLYKMLEDLAARNEIPEKLVKVASGLRDFRNIGAHAGSGDLSTSELPIVRALLDAILTYIYSAQHLADLAAIKLARIKKQRK